MICDTDALILNNLQKGLPIVERPFAEIAACCQTSEAHIFELMESLRAQGKLRRFGAVYDARRIGFHSVLCAASIPEQDLVRFAAYACECDGVTHCYQRGIPGSGAPYPNLWFTLAAPAHEFDHELLRLKEQFAPHQIHALPATRRFKIDVVFDMSTRQKDEMTEPATPMTEVSGKTDAPTFALTDEEWRIVRATQGDIPVQSEFFAPLAETLGVPTELLIGKIADWKDKGIIRRIGAILRHNKIGFTANGMCCWNTDPEKCEAAGRALARCPEVTHCYERPPLPGFPFRLYAMIHANTHDKAREIFSRLSERAGLASGTILFSLREFKKTSMKF